LPDRLFRRLLLNPRARMHNPCVQGDSTDRLVSRALADASSLSQSFGRARTFTRTLSIASARSGRNTNTVSDSAAITPKVDSTNTATATPAPSRPASPGARDVRFAPLTTPYKATLTEGFSSADPNLHAGERAFYEGEQVSIGAGSLFCTQLELHPLLISRSYLRSLLPYGRGL
jgi:hypothetical protein